MGIKITNLELDLLTSIHNEKSRGKDIKKFTELQNKAFSRLLSANLAEVINGFAYVTDVGTKKLRILK